MHYLIAGLSTTGEVSLSFLFYVKSFEISCSAKDIGNVFQIKMQREHRFYEAALNL
jgi:hypothetical protein